MCFAVCKSLGPVVICILGPWIVTELWKPECLHVCPSPKAVTDLLEMIPVNNNSPSLPNMTTFFPSQYVLWCSLDKLCCRGHWTRLGGLCVNGTACAVFFSLELQLDRASQLLPLFGSGEKSKLPWMLLTKMSWHSLTSKESCGAYSWMLSHMKWFLAAGALTF